MTVYAAPNSTIEASLQANNSGGVGTYRISIVDTPSGMVFLPATTGGIVERPTGSGLYHWSGPGPARRGTYSIIWDSGSTSGVLATEELVVSGSVSPEAPTPVAPPAYSPLHRLLVERCSVMRFADLGTEDGTPIQGLTAVQQNVPCRIDLKGGGRANTFLRTARDAGFIESAIAIMPPGTDVRAGDRLKLTRGPRATKVYQVNAAELALGFGAAHHVEADVALIEGIS